MITYDVIIVGHGPAGISAGIYLKRRNLKVLIIGKNKGALENEKIIIENYYGFSKPISGIELVNQGLEQALYLGILLKDEAVLSIKPDEAGIVVETDKDAYYGKTLVLATGKPKSNVSIPGYKALVGQGISVCATCDGFLYRNKKIAVVGSGDYMRHELPFLESMTSNITLYTDGEMIDLNKDYVTHHTKIKSFSKPDLHVLIELEDGSTASYDGVFMLHESPETEGIAKKMGLITDKSHVVVDENYQTNVDRIFAIGDMIGAPYQIAKSVYDGMMVSFSVFNYLRKRI